MSILVRKTKCLFIVKHMGWHGDCCGAGCSELQNSLHHNGRTSILTSSGFTMMFNSLFFKLANLYFLSCIQLWGNQNIIQLILKYTYFILDLQKRPTWFRFIWVRKWGVRISFIKYIPNIGLKYEKSPNHLSWNNYFLPEKVLFSWLW